MAYFFQKIRSLIPFFIFIALDQGIKLLIEYTLPYQQPIFITPFLNLYRTHNSGIAFSLFETLSSKVIIFLTAVLIIYIAYSFYRTPKHLSKLRFGFFLILSGALANFLDRILWGTVIDYMLIHIKNWSFAVFNLADFFITIGAILIVGEEISRMRNLNRIS